MKQFCNNMTSTQWLSECRIQRILPDFAWEEVAEVVIVKLRANTGLQHDLGRRKQKGDGDGWGTGGIPGGQKPRKVFLVILEQYAVS